MSGNTSPGSSAVIGPIAIIDSRPHRERIVGRGGMTGRKPRKLSRRELVSGAGAALAAAALPAALACRRGSKQPAPSRRTLKILQWSHFIPAFDRWFDGVYTKAWGERNSMDVSVDHMSSTEVAARGAAEVAARKGHDLFLFLSPPAAYEAQVHDHRDVVAAVE